MQPTSVQELNQRAGNHPVVAALRKRVGELFRPRMDQVVEGMADHLFTLSSSSGLSPDDRSRCFDAFSAVKAADKVIAADMLGAVIDGFSTLIEAPQDKATKPGPKELNLVDRDEFEDSLAIDKIVKSGSERYWLELEAAALRLGEALSVDPKQIRLPFGLRNLCLAYRHAIAPLDLDKRIIAELDRAFALSLLPELKALYRAINGVLSEAGLFPDLEAELDRGGSRLSASGERPGAKRQRYDEGSQDGRGTADGGEDSPASQRQLGPGFERVPTPQATTDARTPSVQSTASAAALGEAARLLAGATPRSPSPSEAAGRADAVALATEPTSRVAFDSALLRRMQLPEPPADGFVRGTDTDRSIDQLVSGLSAEIAALRNQHPAPEQVRPPLLDLLRFDERGQEYAPVRGNVQMVDELYQTLQEVIPEDSGLTSSALLAKLPLAELSLHEPEFYLNREHPARLLIERLSELSLLSPAHNNRLVERVNDTLETLSRDYNGDPAQFDTALAKLTDYALGLLKQQQRNVQRQVAAEEGRERRHQARLEIERRLADTLPDTELPRSLILLIDRVWRDRLTVASLRSGGEARLAEGLELLSRMAQQLAMVHQDASRANRDLAKRSAAELRQWLGDDQMLAPDEKAPIVAVARQIAGLIPVEYIPSPLEVHDLYAEPGFSQRLERLPRLRRWVRRARSLEVNSWFNNAREGQRPETLKLVWRNVEGTRFSFANAQGQKVRDADLVGVARWLSHSLSPVKPSDQLSVVERSVFSTLERKQADLAREVVGGHSRNLSHRDLVDTAQSMLRRARRRGATHTALIVDGDCDTGADSVVAVLEEARLHVIARGSLSGSLAGLIVEGADTSRIKDVLDTGLADTRDIRVGIATIDADHRSGDELWSAAEESAKLAAADGQPHAVVSRRDDRSIDLNRAVKETLEALRTPVPPRVSLRQLERMPTRPDSDSSVLFQVMLDGMHDAGGEMHQHSGYHSSALSIALDCIKIQSVCQIAQTLTASDREVPVFAVRLSTDAALFNDFLDFVLSEVSDSGIGTDRLFIELRDSLRLREESRAADFARTLRSIGCSIGICEVNPTRGTTSRLEAFSPHFITLDDSLWPGDSSHDPRLPELHRAITDLHHLVGEHVMLRGDHPLAAAAAVGLDYIERVAVGEINPDELMDRAPKLQR